VTSKNRDIDAAVAAQVANSFNQLRGGGSMVTPLHERLACFQAGGVISLVMACSGPRC
jgi:hypothetical protein